MKAEKSIEIKRIDCGKYVIYTDELMSEADGMPALMDLISFLEGTESNEH